MAIQRLLLRPVRRASWLTDPGACGFLRHLSAGAEKALHEFFPITTQLDSAWYEQREGGAVSFKHYEPPLGQAVELRGGAYDTTVQQLEQEVSYGRRCPCATISLPGTTTISVASSPRWVSRVLSGGELDDESVSRWWV